MAEMMAEGKRPEVLFWVGCAGSFDDRAKRISKAFATILHKAGVSFAVLGTEESCTGDPAKRAGNEFLFQMQAMMNIQVLNGYEIAQIVTACPHCFNTIKNEYPSLGGSYEVYHHTQFLIKLFQDGRLKVEGGSFKGRKVVFHDPCYLGRANGEYEAPRSLLKSLDADLAEMEDHRQHGMCCGAGGAQMFKEAEPGDREVNLARTEQALAVEPRVIAAACPFCNTMLTDGVKHFEREADVKVYDIAEIIASTQK
jgi:Fe-S oxidoreductase